MYISIEKLLLKIPTNLVIIKAPLLVDLLKFLMPLYYHIPMGLQKGVIITLKY